MKRIMFVTVTTFFTITLIIGFSANHALGQRKVSLNFDEVDIAIFLKTMSEITGKSFITSDKVKGTISFVSSRDVPVTQVYDIVLSILRARGFYAMPGENNVVYVYPAQEALKMSGQIYYGAEPHEKKIEGVITQIIPLIYADATGVLNVIKPIFPSELLITAYPRTNVLIANGDVGNINLLIKTVQLLDTEVPKEPSDIHIYNLQNADATTLAQTLTTLAGALPVKKEEKLPKPPEAVVQPFSERFNVVANKETNSLLIIAPPKDYEKLEKIIEELDTRREQVLVEALIVELSLKDDQTLGFDWSALIDTSIGAEAVARSNTGLMAQSLQTGGLPGLTVGLLNGTIPDAYVILNANREKTNLKVLSTPEIVTADNHEATIKIGEQIPFLTSSRVDEQGNVIQTYDYKDVGIILKLTPHINKNGYVTMEINQEIKKIVEGTELLENPSVFNRQVSSRITVKDKRTIVIGGLIRDDVTTIEQKVPLLGDIPILGLFFRKNVKQRTRTNLLIFITPHIITADQDIERITEQKKREQEEYEKSKK
ncbi:MAG: secretin N-terminal domain-containing protein [Spirochaetota bacterium]